MFLKNDEARRALPVRVAVLFAAAMVVMAGFTSCGKKSEKLQTRVEKLQAQAAEAEEAGNADKAAKLEEEIAKLTVELNEEAGKALGKYPADLQIAYLNMFGVSLTVRDLFGTPGNFSKKFQGKPISVKLESIKTSPDRLTATLLSTLENGAKTRGVFTFTSDSQASYFDAAKVTVYDAKGAVIQENEVSANGQYGMGRKYGESLGFFVGIITQGFFWDF